jgi:hypothetical protein
MFGGFWDYNNFIILTGRGGSTLPIDTSKPVLTINIAGAVAPRFLFTSMTSIITD